MTMNRIVLHHTGGPGTPTAADRAHYHRIVDAAGKVHDGDHPISANAPGASLEAGRYAAHTRGLNTGAIGLSMCAMGGAQEKDPKGSTRFFPTAAQVQGLVREAARLCRIHGIRPDARTVLTHAEVQPTLGVRQAQKWDCNYDPLGLSETRDPIAIGDMLRARIAAEIEAQAADGLPVTLPPAAARPVLRIGAKGDDVRAVQAALNLAVDGDFGRKTRTAVIAFQRTRQMLADGAVGPVTWAALFPAN